MSKLDDAIKYHEQIADRIREIIKIREKYEHLAEVSCPIWKQRFENDKNN